MREKKAQTSFEVILISTLALMIVLGMLGLVPSTMSAIGKTAVVKSEALKILNAQDKFYYIAEVKDAVTSTTPNTITILVGGDNVTLTEIASLKTEFNAVIRQKLVDAEFYSAITEVEISVEKAP
ncbi:MAG: hypothetical protein NT067_06005 [Candidatus Diapherotrites archaeon]|nr:hypothetical protein [Candidatus Diapherotrites archaeon]